MRRDPIDGVFRTDDTVKLFRPSVSRERSVTPCPAPSRASLSPTQGPTDSELEKAGNLEIQAHRYSEEIARHALYSTAQDLPRNPNARRTCQLTPRFDSVSGRP
jgi:hypothetical protein